MSVKKKIGLPATKLIAIAGLAGLLAGGAAIYVKESLSGNATGAVASADPAVCAAAGAKAAAITPFSKGQVAAMRTVDEHRPLAEREQRLVDAQPAGRALAEEVKQSHAPMFPRRSPSAKLVHRIPQRKRPPTPTTKFATIPSST